MRKRGMMSREQPTEKIGRLIEVRIPNKWLDNQGAISGPFRIMIFVDDYPTYCSTSFPHYQISRKISDTIITK